MGVYARPDLLNGISKDLKTRMQGKSRFNLTTVDEALFAELEDLIVRGFDAVLRGHKCQSVSFVSSRRNVRNLLWPVCLGVTPVRFCAPQFSTVAATLRICADWSQKQ